MRALQITELGKSLQEVDLPDPSPGSGEVLIDVKAAGICRSDLHYRSGSRPVPGLPLIPGHEVSGVVGELGEGVAGIAVGDRVALHYLSRCGRCRACVRGAEQFCVSGQMLGFNRPGGYAEAIVVPAENAVPVPDGVPLEWAAVMMCSTSTVFHALRRGRFAAGESVAVVGVGGLGASAVKVAAAMGAGAIIAIDINPAKLALAESWGAIPIDARDDPAGATRAATGGRGVDMALELLGSAETTRTAIDVLAAQGRAVIAGISPDVTSLRPFSDLVVREAEILGAADHLLGELPVLLEWARTGVLDYSDVVTTTIPLELDAVEAALVALEDFGDSVRTVITP